jgi:predicted Zn-dependent peptidase
MRELASHKEERLAEIYHRTWPNGLTLLAEEMPEVRTAAFTMLVPAGHIYDPARGPGHGQRAVGVDPARCRQPR